MSIMQRQGIKALSQLEIDVDKDWQVYGVSRLKEVTPGMVIGDIVVRGSSLLTRLPPGPADYVLTSAGPGVMPVWRAPAAPFEPYFPIWMYSDRSAGIVPVLNQDVTLVPPTTPSELEQTPTGAPQPTIPHDESIVTPVTQDVVTAVTSPFMCQLWPDGAIAFYGNPPAEYDRTAEARSEAVDDVQLPPQNPRIPPDECIYLGLVSPFVGVDIHVTTKGTGNFAVDLRYWDGGAWSVPPNFDDHLDDFQSLGVKYGTWTVPGDWALSTIGGYNLYWVRIACVSMISLTTAPLAQKIYLRLP